MILVDTQAIFWLVSRPTRLSAVARKAIERERRTGGLTIASVTLMELAQIAATGRVRIRGTPEKWLRELVDETGLAVKDLSIEIASVAAHLPPNFPPDPFDRVIAGTAMVEGIPLVTSDARIQHSGVVRTIW